MQSVLAQRSFGMISSVRRVPLTAADVAVDVLEAGRACESVDDAALREAQSRSTWQL